MLDMKRPPPNPHGHPATLTPGGSVRRVPLPPRPDTWRDIDGDALRTWRKHTGLARDALAERWGVARSTLQKWEGEAPPPLTQQLVWARWHEGPLDA